MNLVVERLRQKIRNRGVEPDVCPRCRKNTLWPEPHIAFNSVCRKDNKTYICAICGMDQALSDAGY